MAEAQVSADGRCAAALAGAAMTRLA